MTSTVEFNEEFFEWEERADDMPFGKHMIAGSLAGVVEHCSLLPLDNVKTHRQSLLVRMSLPQTISYIHSQPGGIFNFWRGSGVMAMGCVPAHALFFSIYEVATKKFGLHHSNHLHFDLHAAVGAISSAFHDLIMLPCEGRIESYKF
jgi:solute carrier family 25 iron transporter 28/37